MRAALNAHILPAAVEQAIQGILQILNTSWFQPDFVHVLAHGEIKLSGDHTLAEKLEREGYEGIEAA